MGIEPTARAMRAAGFEDRAGHQARIASIRTIGAMRGGVEPLRDHD